MLRAFSINGDYSPQSHKSTTSFAPLPHNSSRLVRFGITVLNLSVKPYWHMKHLPFCCL